MTRDATDNGAKSLEEQLQDMLRKANLAFVGQAGTAPRAAETAPPEPQGPTQEDRLKPIREFALKPRDIRDYLDRFVVRQDEAKKVLAVAICDHYNHVRRCIEDAAAQEDEYAKHNIILLGPTGVGKTYMMRCVARLIGVPFVKADATKFTETGYVGHDADDLVRDLVKAADGDVDLAQYGIIYLDEIDKIAAQSTNGGKDVSGRGVQINLLKLMEETDVGLFSQTDLIGQMQAVMNLQRGQDAGKRTINTRHILFIVSGAFDKLADQVRRRVGSSPIGFTDGDARPFEEGNLLRQAATRDFIDYGFEPEFIGRLPVRVVCDALKADDLVEIMQHAEGSILSQYARDFAGYGIEFNADEEAVRAIAELADLERTGARGLMTVLERVFREYKFELPSTRIRRFDVTRATVMDGAAAMAAVLKQNESVRREALREDLERYGESFKELHGLTLAFDRDAAEAVIDACLSDGRTVRGLSEDRFRDFEYAFSLMARNTGRSTFRVTKKLVENPGEELSRRVAESFRKG